MGARRGRAAAARMSLALAAALGALVTAVAFVAARRRARSRAAPRSGVRIAFPFIGHCLSERALDAALRLAHAQSATLVPVFLAVVPLRLTLESALPRQSAQALDLLEAIEQRAARAGVPVDARIERGRTPRHALTEALRHERFGRIVVPAETRPGEGFSPADIAWLLERACEEVVVLRPARTVEPAASRPARGTIALGRAH